MEAQACVEHDIKLAQHFGWKDIEQSDFGGIVGVSPENGRMENIPRPTENIEDSYKMLMALLSEGALFSIWLKQDGDYSAEFMFGMESAHNKDRNSLHAAASAAIKAIENTRNKHGY